MQPDITLRKSDLELLNRLVEETSGDDARALLLERLETELSRARIVDDAGPLPGVVTLGSRVTFKTQETGKTRELVLVLPEDANSAENLSVLTPMGCSLLGLRVGDVFTWNERGKQWRLKVLSVEQP